MPEERHDRVQAQDYACTTAAATDRRDVSEQSRAEVVVLTAWRSLITGTPNELPDNSMGAVLLHFIHALLDIPFNHMAFKQIINLCVAYIMVNIRL